MRSRAGAGERGYAPGRLSWRYNRRHEPAGRVEPRIHRELAGSSRSDFHLSVRPWKVTTEHCIGTLTSCRLHEYGSVRGTGLPSRRSLIDPSGSVMPSSDRRVDMHQQG